MFHISYLIKFDVTGCGFQFAVIAFVHCNAQQVSLRKDYQLITIAVKSSQNSDGGT